MSVVVAYKNPEDRRACGRRHYWRNKEKIRARKKDYEVAYYKLNADQKRGYQIARNKTNPEVRKAYREANAEYIKAKWQEWYQANYPSIKARQLAYLKDPRRKLVYCCRRATRDALRGHKKSAKSLILLGCDSEWLMAWIEIQFQPGMTWENYGLVWHIDHKRPCASFDLNDPIQQRMCFHWTNLQPLFAEENLKKSSKWTLSSSDETSAKEAMRKL